MTLVTFMAELEKMLRNYAKSSSNQVFSNIIGHKRSIGRVNKYETDLLRCPGLVHWPVLLQKYEPDFLRISQVGLIFNLFSYPMFVGL